jgi:hypothetical protein
MEYKIIIGRPPDASDQRPPRPQGKLQLLKAGLLSLLALSAVIGTLLAAFVVGSVIASLLLILLAASLIIWFIRRIFLSLKRRRGRKSL